MDEDRTAPREEDQLSGLDKKLTHLIAQIDESKKEQERFTKEQERFTKEQERFAKELEKRDKRISELDRTIKKLQNDQKSAKGKLDIIIEKLEALT